VTKSGSTLQPTCSNGVDWIHNHDGHVALNPICIKVESRTWTWQESDVIFKFLSVHCGTPGSACCFIKVKYQLFKVWPLFIQSFLMRVINLQVHFTCGYEYKSVDCNSQLRSPWRGKIYQDQPLLQQLEHMTTASFDIAQHREGWPSTCDKTGARILDFWVGWWRLFHWAKHPSPQDTNINVHACPCNGLELWHHQLEHRLVWQLELYLLHCLQNDEGRYIIYFYHFVFGTLLYFRALF
jgi:hypothetical protein